MWRGLALLALLPLAAGCATTGASAERSADASSGTEGPGCLAVLRTARGLVGRRSVRFKGQTYPDDCTGLVRAVYRQVGIPLLSEARQGDNGVTAIYRYVKDHGRVFRGGRPTPGDLVFFKDTYGDPEGRLTHVALVDAVEEDGTVEIIHRVHAGVVRYRMNVARADLSRDPKTGRLLNDYLRTKTGRPTLVLTGQLFVAYGAVLPGQGPELSDGHLPFLRPEPEGSSI